MRIGGRAPAVGVAGVLLAVLTVGCAGAPPSAQSLGSPGPLSSTSAPVTPANIKRVAGQLPPGYEHADTADLAAPAQIWGLGAVAITDPPRCADLVDPAGEPSGRGVSGSGVGGIVYAVVAPTPVDAAPPDAALLVDCAAFAASFARTTVDVVLIDPPHIDDATTVGMASRSRTSVEGGGEIVSRAYTFIAYLDGYRAVSALVIDPGSPDPSLPAQFAADLLVRTVTELRG